ncbi:TIGR04282 family arsenosugar biosynthesis glycosyltransferase [Roseovarius nitratireducens]|uniref:TIGR04282 family arsenosugar biosynthesis glycosyltransferase n=1 Tax=Roseovarius nitratireducens TaxID=2044597 RepID=UPI000CE18DBB|nr:TIGR04282 family arsenosugar biosynthesis glycosyltransferase [Roseovarius nitratireducens]
MTRQTLVVMVKEPHPGRVKTRLGRELGMIAAAWWFRHQVARLLRRVEDPRWRLVLAVSPDAEGLASRVWPAHLPRMPQGKGDLGDRMRRIFRSLPPGPVCIVGADIPGIDRPHIARAFAALGGHDAVIGPAPDGGYWLIGLKRTTAVPARLFEGVRWSGAHARADTVASLGRCRVALVDTLSDVDEARDLSPAAAQRPAAGFPPTPARPPR